MIFKPLSWRHKYLLLFLLTILFIALPIASSFAFDVDINAMLTTLRKNLPKVVRFIIASSYVVGIWLIYSGLYSLKIYGDMRTMMPSQGAGMGKYLSRMIIGTLLLLMPRLVKLSIWTLWGTDYTIIDYPDWGADLNQWRPALNGAVAVVRVLGYISFFRGFLMFARSSGQNVQPGTFGKGAIHVIGGILCINITGTIEIIRHTFGFS